MLQNMLSSSNFHEGKGKYPHIHVVFLTSSHLCELVEGGGSHDNNIPAVTSSLMKNASTQSGQGQFSAAVCKQSGC